MLQNREFLANIIDTCILEATRLGFTVSYTYKFAQFAEGKVSMSRYPCHKSGTPSITKDSTNESLNRKNK